MNPKRNFDLEYWKTSPKTCVFYQILWYKMWFVSRPRAREEYALNLFIFHFDPPGGSSLVHLCELLLSTEETYIVKTIECKKAMHNNLFHEKIYFTNSGSNTWGLCPYGHGLMFGPSWSQTCLKWSHHVLNGASWSQIVWTGKKWNKPSFVI